MLSFEDWASARHHLDVVIEELEARMEYRMIELGCGDRGPSRLTQEQEVRVNYDETIKELRYLRGLYVAKREYLKANGVLPPEEVHGAAAG